MASQLPGISGMRRETGGESEGETGCRGAREIQSKCPVQMIVGKTKCSTACICSSNDVPVVMVGLMLAPGMSLWRTTYITFSPPLMQLVLWPKQARARPSGNTSSGGPSAACPAPPGGAGSRSAGGPLLRCREALAGQLALQHVVLCSQPCPSAMVGPVRLCLAELLVTCQALNISTTLTLLAELLNPKP